MDTSRQAEICQEARFVLWALRCLVAGARGDEDAQEELAQGFELADVPETAGAFGRLADALCAVQWPLPVWHHPRCSCVSAEEMCVLRALAETAERQRHTDPRPAQWWLLLLSADGVRIVDAAARSWLAVLERAGVVFPSPAELLECLQPLEVVAEPAPLMRVH
ncbi:MAG: hypothetical protein WDO12_10875 [Pseudomonadota bacterium]